MGRRNLQRAVTSVLFAVFLASTAYAQAPAYRVTDLGEFIALDVNDHGQVAGQEIDSWGSVLYSYGSLIGIDSGGAAFGINEKGEVTGEGSTPGEGYLWSPTFPNGTTQDSKTSLAFAGQDINNLGDVVGYAFDTNNNLVPYLYSSSTATQLSTLGGDQGFAYAINDAGNVVGYAQDDPDINSNIPELPVEWISGSPSSLGTFGGNYGYAYDINNSGDIVGSANSDDYNVPLTAFLLPNGGVMTNLGVLSGDDGSAAYGVNEHEVVVGVSEDSFFNQRAFVYNSMDGMLDLNSLIGTSGWSLQFATAVNNCGQIVGYGTLSSDTHSFMLTPQNTAFVYYPDPATTSGDDGLTDSSDADSTELTSQRRCVTLQGLGSSGYLSGDYAVAQIASGTRAQESDFVFDYTREDGLGTANFEEVMAYFHTDAVARYLHDDLGLSYVRTTPLVSYVNDTDPTTTAGGARYYAGTGALYFGTEATGLIDVDLAEDAEIIWHETGHAIIDEMIPGYGDDAESYAIAEGFGDYFATSQFATGGSWDLFYAKWAGNVPAAGGNPPHQRIVNSANVYPDDFDLMDPPHMNGMIWSATLWDIRGIVGKTQADTIAVDGFFRVFDVLGDPAATSASFRDYAKGILASNTALYSGANQTSIKNALTSRGVYFELDEIQVSPSSVVGGTSATGTVTLTAKAPVGGVTIDLADFHSAAGVPPFVTVPEGQTSANFTVTTTTVSSVTNGAFEASYDGITDPVPFTVTP